MQSVCITPPVAEELQEGFGVQTAFGASKCQKDFYLENAVKFDV